MVEYRSSVLFWAHASRAGSLSPAALHVSRCAAAIGPAPRYGRAAERRSTAILLGGMPG
ncbi:hypothetical protein [Burkholderia sola]|uniref:hypothetical protein n=1 Tax=Burkholderia sola TaxID=2843302 RepID=UPI0023DE0CD3|nr:hypothetical protein [Burkholderia sola]MDF3085530.1 hypothetical protein [Burkholderia sola]